MKKITTLLFVAILSFASTQAQTVDDILKSYFENIGGKENLKKLKGLKMVAKINQGGIEIPIEIYKMADGKQMTKITFQGKVIKQGVYDGKTLWANNFMTMKAEKSPKETTENFKLEINDFPDSFIGYKEKGYKVELLGKETVDGAEAFKIKLVKEPLTIEGKKVDDISYYFFDTENFVPIAIHKEITSGPAKGMTSEIIMSDYQEVDGLYFPFSIKQGIKGKGGQPVSITKIELNPTIDDSEFKFPAK